MSIFDDENVRFTVVVNHEEQYSLWPEGRAIPKGWRSVEKSGTKQECLDHIKLVWTDMRPLSLRLKMDKIHNKEAQTSKANSA